MSHTTPRIRADKGTQTPSYYPNLHTGKMIAQQLRDTLDEQIEFGDYQIAAQIYLKKVKKPISPRYLHKFIKGQKNPTGRPGRHDPEAMFAAIVEAVSQRQERVRKATESARKFMDKIIHDTAPKSPIAL